MSVPFLHMFRSKSKIQSKKDTANLVNAQAWPLSMIGSDGPKMITFAVMGLGDAAPRRPGIFIYARKTHTQDWQALYIGESANLQSRLAFNEIAADALLSGATDIHILQLDTDASIRRDLCEQLIRTNHPPLNDEQRRRLAPTSTTAPQTTQKGRTRAA